MEPSSRQGAREAGTLYTQPVNMARFFYMDNILLSVSGNKLFIHSLKLPENPGQIESSHYKLSKGRFRKRKDFIPLLNVISHLRTKKLRNFLQPD